MPLNHRHKSKIINGYIILFYMLMLFKWYNGLFLWQVQPFLYNSRPDLLTWVFMQSGLHTWLLNNPAGWVIFDTIYFSIPLLCWVSFNKSKKSLPWLAFLMLLINWVYIQCYTLFPTNSIEGYLVPLLFPMLLMMSNLRSFYFMLQGLRYFFLFFFASAGIWKFVQGGIFFTDQMSGILLFQHKELLVTSQGHWYSYFIYWLINHTSISYSLYLAGTILELSFIVGFFTKKYDRLLIIGFILFLLLDVLIMRIHYWEMAPFLLTLLFSKYKMPERSISSAKSGSLLGS